MDDGRTSDPRWSRRLVVCLAAALLGQATLFIGFAAGQSPLVWVGIAVATPALAGVTVCQAVLLRASRQA